MRDPLHFALVLTLLSAGTPAGSGAQTGDPPVVLRFGGDCLLAGHYETAAADSPSLAFATFDLFQTDDFSVVNLESPVTTRGTPVPKPYNFRTRPVFVAALHEAGVDLVTIANNHIFDYGPVGLFDTMRQLDSLGMPFAGAGATQERAHRPHLVTLRGKRVAFFAYYKGGEAPAATPDSPGVAVRTLRRITEDIRRARRTSGADHVIVSLHWGTEKAETPEPWQRRFARAVINAGADALIGHHPHVLQGIERYRNGVIAYSLGNLVFGGNSRDTYDTAVLELRLSATGIEPRLIPVRVEGWRVRTLSGPEGDRVSEHVQSLSRILQGPILNRKEQR